jgi:predicted GIY-YIG superfamily endonuclease
MAFWTYMLHCRGGYFYVAHTDDLERRIAQHHSGTPPGFTADHSPVELVWSQECMAREDAKASERQINGWSRAKKLALIPGDWKRIATLTKKKGSPSAAQSGRSLMAVPKA